MRYLLGAYFWVMTVIYTIALWILVLLRQALVVLRGEPRDGRPIHKIASLWGRGIIGMMPGWKVTVEGKENIPPDGVPVVIVANHESMSDIWAMYYLGIQFRWLSKIEIKKIPIVGRSMTWAGYVFIRRGDKQSHSESLARSREILASGIPMFFFPEGTRSPDGTVRDFKVGAFRLAQEAKVDILPVAIHGAGNLFRKHSALPGTAHVKVKVLPRVAPPAPGESLDTYAATIREQIVKAHATLV